MTTAYPLSWPDHIDRHRTREQGRFKTSLSSALNNVRAAWAEADAARAAAAVTHAAWAARAAGAAAGAAARAARAAPLDLVALAEKACAGVTERQVK